MAGNCWKSSSGLAVSGRGIAGHEGHGTAGTAKGAITWNMQIVFYTAYDKYMIYAIRGAAFDYLLKPIDKKELEGIIDRFMKRRKSRQPHLWLSLRVCIRPASILL